MGKRPPHFSGPEADRKRRHHHFWRGEGLSIRGRPRAVACVARLWCSGFVHALRSAGTYDDDPLAALERSKVGSRTTWPPEVRRQRSQRAGTPLRARAARIGSGSTRWGSINGPVLDGLSKVASTDGAAPRQVCNRACHLQDPVESAS
jgi:hypothetical protein